MSRKVYETNIFEDKFKKKKKKKKAANAMKASERAKTKYFPALVRLFIS